MGTLLRLLSIAFSVGMLLATYGHARAGDWDAATFFLIVTMFWDYRERGR